MSGRDSTDTIPIWPNDAVTMRLEGLIGVIEPIESYAGYQHVTGTLTCAYGACGERVVVLDAPTATGVCVVLVKDPSSLILASAEAVVNKNGVQR